MISTQHSERQTCVRSKTKFQKFERAVRLCSQLVRCRHTDPTHLGITLNAMIDSNTTITLSHTVPPQHSHGLTWLRMIMFRVSFSRMRKSEGNKVTMKQPHRGPPTSSHITGAASTCEWPHTRAQSTCQLHTCTTWSREVGRMDEEGMCGCLGRGCSGLSWKRWARLTSCDLQSRNEVTWIHLTAMHATPSHLTRAHSMRASAMYDEHMDEPMHRNPSQECGREWTQMHCPRKQTKPNV